MIVQGVLSLVLVIVSSLAIWLVILARRVAVLERKDLALTVTNRLDRALQERLEWPQHRGGGDTAQCFSRSGRSPEADGQDRHSVLARDANARPAQLAA